MTTHVNVEELIGEMVERIVDRFHPLRIVLFGSQGRGGAGPDSDVDLLVVLPEAHDTYQATRQILKALADIPWCKDIIVISEQQVRTWGDVKNTALYSALREGQSLYERTTR